MDFNKYTLVIWSVVSMSALVNAAVNLATGNIATSQSSNYNEIWVSSKAVHGCIHQNIDSNCCTHTAGGQTEVWWQADLRQQSVIQTVEILYRDEGILSRLAGFEIYLSDTSDWRSGLRCYRDNTASLALMTATQNVPCVGIGRYVTIYNNRRVIAKQWYSDEAVLELCKVYIYGCTLGKFGNGHCNDDCFNCLSNICHPTSGVCDSCAAGYYRSIDVCVPCPQNCVGNNCDGSSGACSGGCKAGFSGTYCRCPLNCADHSCPSTGQCSNCNDGYYGPNCTPCPTGCSTNTCDQTSGNCFDCNDGYYGATCIQCPAGCSTNTCDKTSGNCYQCTAGLFGNKCNQQCAFTCKDNMCNKNSGQCDDCSDGYYGQLCLACPTGCSTSTCDKTSGRCFECKAGLFRDQCNQNCTFTCKDNMCNKNSGQCDD
ncbi:scavenger receptor class F member 1-like isoform X2 [Argopecten irradians]|uniref:scavenger receptor class F member 1-like isoform X2 n=1 Tax=Argopecten irradians TaxID=31199 RepID=UPI00371B6464